MGSITSKRTRPEFTIKTPMPAATRATDGLPSADEIRARIAAQDAAAPPTRENRPAETFNTVSEDLYGTMSINPADPKARPVFRRIADNMVQLLDDAQKPLTEDESLDLQMAVGAYQEAFQRLNPESQAAILEFLPRDESGNLTAAAEQVATTFQKYIEPVMDRPVDVDPDIRMGRDAVLTDEAGDATRVEQKSARQLIDRLLRDGVPASELNQAVTADALVPPPQGPEQGVFSGRDEWPADWALSSYIGGDTANKFRPQETPNERDIASELLGPYHAMTSQVDATGQPYRDPVLPKVVGEPEPHRDMLYAGTGEYDYGSDESYRTAARQMRSQGDDVREELFQRAFGMPHRVGRKDQIGPADFERVAPMNLDYVAPWWRGEIEQVVDGQIVHGPMDAEQLTKSIISQYGFLEKQPELRSAALELLIPHVEEAMLAATGTPPSYRATQSAGQRYSRNEAGRSLFQGLINEGAAPPKPAAKPYTPDFDALDAMGKRLREAGRSVKPRDNETGFVQPFGVNKDMMNNRLLSGLFA